MNISRKDFKNLLFEHNYSYEYQYDSIYVMVKKYVMDMDIKQEILPNFIQDYLKELQDINVFEFVPFIGDYIRIVSSDHNIIKGFYGGIENNCIILMDFKNELIDKFNINNIFAVYMIFSGEEEDRINAIKIKLSKLQKLNLKEGDKIVFSDEKDKEFEVCRLELNIDDKSDWWTEIGVVYKSKYMDNEYYFINEHSKFEKV